jgi:hypothetical protein
LRKQQPEHVKFVTDDDAHLDGADVTCYDLARRIVKFRCVVAGD